MIYWTHWREQCEQIGFSVGVTLLLLRRNGLSFSSFHFRFLFNSRGRKLFQKRRKRSEKFVVFHKMLSFLPPAQLLHLAVLLLLLHAMILPSLILLSILALKRLMLVLSVIIFLIFLFQN